MRVVAALGGNALVPDGASPSAAAQQDAMQATAAQVGAVLDAGHEVVLTHGNGPQVGNRLLQQEHATETASMPLDVLVAETQAQIGYLLQQALDNAVDTDHDFLTVVTQAVVAPADSAFDDPSKPVGPWYTADEAADKPFPTREVGQGERPYRRVVPSPTPQRVVESEEIRTMVDRGSHVVCCGGGGVPVVADGGLQGVEAVVDKDRVSAVLAAAIDADVLAILTDVPYAYTGYGTADQTPIEAATPDELQELLDSGAFGAGSMRPKVAACIQFINDGGKRAVITEPDRLQAGLAGDAGTQVVP